jgi:hypothetical protein
LSAFRSLITSQENENLTFGQAWYLIRNFETQTIANEAISADEKEMVLLCASALRNILKYAHETGEIADDRSNDCFLGRKLSCWEDALEKTALEALKAALSVVFPELLAHGFNFNDYSPDFWKSLKKVVFKTGGIGLVFNVVNIYLKAECRCNHEAGGNNSTTCKNPAGISIFPGDCNPLEQTFRAWGYSAPTGAAFEWVVSGGVFPDNNNSTSIITLTPEVRVRQNSPSVPITLGVRMTCLGPTAPYSIAPPMSIPALVNSTGTMFVWGPQEVNKGNYHYKYEFWGSWLNSQNTVLFYSGCTLHGQVMESGIDYVKVKWNTNQPAYPVPRVTGIVKNLCSDASLTAVLDVIVH